MEKAQNYTTKINFVNPLQYLFAVCYICLQEVREAKILWFVDKLWKKVDAQMFTRSNPKYM
ncbi:protein of unknown function [Limnospira indica PCC 8005]|uniref:Uncharacterized protein n=1 Tax=Limnospira indica PCC 8005 TaxID=376219 RepID=A0A9P1KHA0_9CYAN|nr:protein of unknown function [Limnospira indica PCC 8005]